MDSILQIDIQSGEIVDEFLEIKDAVKKYPQYRSLRRGIKNCLDGISKTSYEFIWIYKSKHKSKEGSDDIKKEKEIVDTILQIEKGVIIGEFKTVKDATDKYPEYGRLNEGIIRCLRGKAKTSYEFGWIYRSKYGIEEEEVKEKIIIEKPEDPNILQIDIKSGKIVGEFSEVKDAVKKYPEFTSLNRGIKNCLSGKYESSYDYKWVYKSYYIPEEITLEDQEIKIICQIDIKNKLVVQEFNTIDGIILKYPTFTSLKYGIRNCLKGKTKTSYEFGWIYKSKLEELGMEQYILNINIKRPDALFIELYPELAKEWNYDKNTHADINTISFGSDIKVYWNCPKDSTHLAYLSTLHSRTYGKNCKLCGMDSRRIYDKKEKEDHIAKHDISIKRDDVKTGDDTEIYLLDLLREDKRILEVVRVGNIGDNADLIITLLSGEKKSLQVKTLSYTGKTNVYSMSNKHIYPDNMLIAMINKERTCFALEFAGNIKTVGISLPFNSRVSKYLDIMFKDKQLFVDKLIELIPSSTDYRLQLSESSLKEYDSLRRLELWCINKDLIFRRNDTNGNTIDAFINDIPIQCKYSSLNHNGDLTYLINTSKSAGHLNGSTIKKPYTINEPFETLVVEVGGTREDPQRYHGNFCFIPKSILIETNVLSSEISKGRKSINICPPDYDKPHWSKDLWY